MPARPRTASKASTKQTEPLPPADAEAAINTLTQMAEKPKVTPFQEVVQRAKEQIISAFKQGYTRQDICNAMRQHGIKVTPRMLIEYVPEVRGGRTSKREIVQRLDAVIDRPKAKSAPVTEAKDEGGNELGNATKLEETGETVNTSQTADQPEEASSATTAKAKTPSKTTSKTPAKTAAKVANRPTTAKTPSKSTPKPTTKPTTKRPTTKG